MCEYCGCHQNDVIGRFMDEHDRLLNMGDTARRCLDAGDTAGALAAMEPFRALMADHGHREEIGIFAVMKEAGEFVEVIDDLTAEHRDVDQRLARLTDPEVLRAELDALMADLADHIERENRGIFPFAYSAFSPAQWSQVTEAMEAEHARQHAEGIEHHH